MTKHECAIVMAYTGVCMLKGDDLQIFYDYVAEIMGRPLYTHEIGEQADTIKDAAKDDFMKLCESAKYTYLTEARRKIPGMTVTDAFDKEYFKPGRFFIMEEWDVKMPTEPDGEYTPIGVKSAHLVKIREVGGNSTYISVDVLDDSPVQSKLIARASLVIHGYYKFIPAIVRREGEECT